MGNLKTIPYGHQWIKQDAVREVVKVLKSDWISQGPTIKKFEDSLRKHTGAKYAIAVSNGTAALHLCCLAAGIRAKDEAITSSLTFLASANCVLYCGGRPIFCDIEEDTINIDHRLIEDKVTDKTKAIIPVHFAGHPCDLEEIGSIAKKYKLTVIEDAAHAQGAEYKGSKIGSCKYSDMTIFSFHPLKAITTGEGGAILTNRRDLYERLLRLRNHGIVRDSDKFINTRNFISPIDLSYYEMQELGFNYRITDIQCALGISQLKNLKMFINRRREIASFYNKAFKGNPYFDLPAERDYVRSAYHLYSILLKKKLTGKKKEVLLKMKEKGLGIQVHYIPVYLHPYYRSLGYTHGLCLEAENIYRREISIPIYPALKDAQAKYVAESVLAAFREVS